MPTGRSRVPRVAACGRVQCNANAIIYPFKSAIMWRIQTPHLVRLMNIVSNWYVAHCRNNIAAKFEDRACDYPLIT